MMLLHSVSLFLKRPKGYYISLLFKRKTPSLEGDLNFYKDSVHPVFSPIFMFHFHLDFQLFLSTSFAIPFNNCSKTGVYSKYVIEKLSNTMKLNDMFCFHGKISSSHMVMHSNVQYVF